MHVERAALQARRQRDLGDGLARPRPERLDRAEGGAEVDPDRGLGAVVAREIHRRESGLQALDVERGRGRRRAGRAVRDAALRVQRPSVLALAPAEDADATRRAVLVAVEQHLHPPARVGGAVLGVFVREDQRALHLEVVDDHRLAALGEGGRRGHGAIERARRDQPAEDPMIGEPRRIGGEDFGVERDLAAGGLVPAAEQRVVACLPTPLRRLDPVPLALERITRQRDAAARLAREEPREFEREPGFVGARDGVREAAAGARRRRLLVLRWPNEARQDHRRRPGRLGPRHGRHRPEHGVGADLDDRIDTQLRQRLDAGTEGHGLARLTPPVRRIRRLSLLQRPPGQVADEGGRRRLERDRRDRGFQIAQRRLDHGAVVGRALPEPRDAHLVGLEAGEQRLDTRLGAAHHLVGAIVRGDADVRPVGGRVVLVQHRGDARSRREHGSHGALAGQRADEASPRRGKVQALLQAEDACGVRRRDLPQAVPDHHVRPDADARPERRERAFERVDRRLLPPRIVQLARSAGPAEHHVEQRGAVPLLRQQRVAAVEDRAHDRLAGVERRAHAGPLAGLAGVGERDPGRRLRPRPLVSLLQRRQARPQRALVVEHHAPAVAEVAAAPACRPGHVGERVRAGGGIGVVGVIAGRRARPLVEPREIPPRERAKRPVRLAGEGQDAGPARGGGGRRPGRRLAGHRLRQGDRDRPRRADRLVTVGRAGRSAVPGAVSLQHHVGVRARPAEPAHARPGRTLGVVRPRRGGRRHLERQPLPVDFRSRDPEMEVPGNHPRFMASTVLMTPATPAAASRWPMLVLTEPISRGRSASRPRLYAVPVACASIGSPTSVPVPCAST